MTMVQIVDPVELWMEGDIEDVTVEQLRRGWLVLDPVSGRFSYERGPGGPPLVAVPIPAVTAEYAAEILARLAPAAQRFLDAEPVTTGRAEAEFALRSAADQVPTPDKTLVMPVDPADWIAERYGTRMGMVAAIGLTPDVSEQWLDAATAAETRRACDDLPYAQVLLPGFRAVLARIRRGLRQSVIQEAILVKEQIADLQRRQRANVRRFAAWDMSNREIEMAGGPSHTAVAKQRPGPKGMIQRIRLRAETGRWQLVPETARLRMRYDGMLIEVDQAGGEIVAYVDGQDGIQTGVWHTPPSTDETSTDETSTDAGR